MHDPDSHLPQGALLNQLSIPVRWGDMDSLGHVNNTLYFRYFETVRMQWFASLAEQLPANRDEGIVIVDSTAEFLIPVVCPANVLVRMGGHSPGRSSFVSTYTITVDDTLTTRGHARVVWVNNHDMKSRPLPAHVRQLIEPIN